VLEARRLLHDGDGTNVVVVTGMVVVVAGFVVVGPLVGGVVGTVVATVVVGFVPTVVVGFVPTVVFTPGTVVATVVAGVVVATIGGPGTVTTIIVGGAMTGGAAVAGGPVVHEALPDPLVDASPFPLVEESPSTVTEQFEPPVAVTLPLALADEPQFAVQLPPGVPAAPGTRTGVILPVAAPVVPASADA
jgi:hypothetical protein